MTVPALTPTTPLNHLSDSYHHNGRTALSSLTGKDSFVSALVEAVPGLYEGLGPTGQAAGWSSRAPTSRLKY